MQKVLFSVAANVIWSCPEMLIHFIDPRPSKGPTLTPIEGLINDQDGDSIHLVKLESHGMA
jgi:hypothetical protein